MVVFIHGGDFQSGSSSDYPQDAILNNFVARKTVFVSINYRLGPLGKHPGNSSANFCCHRVGDYRNIQPYFVGFLSTGDAILPGNNGLWDQILALKWVKINAHVFGGDPDNILLMGHGSGAAAASLLALSPMADGEWWHNLRRTT